MKKLVYRPARIKDWQDILAQLERRRDQGMTLAQSCRVAGISRSTYWEWTERKKKLERKR